MSSLLWRHKTENGLFIYLLISKIKLQTLRPPSPRVKDILETCRCSLVGSLVALEVVEEEAWRVKPDWPFGLDYNTPESELRGSRNCWSWTSDWSSRTVWSRAHHWPRDSGGGCCCRCGTGSPGWLAAWWRCSSDLCFGGDLDQCCKNFPPQRWRLYPLSNLSWRCFYPLPSWCSLTMQRFITSGIRHLQVPLAGHPCRRWG